MSHGLSISQLQVFLLSYFDGFDIVICWRGEVRYSKAAGCLNLRSQVVSQDFLCSRDSAAAHAR